MGAFSCRATVKDGSCAGSADGRRFLPPASAVPFGSALGAPACGSSWLSRSWCTGAAAGRRPGGARRAARGGDREAGTTTEGAVAGAGDAPEPLYAHGHQPPSVNGPLPLSGGIWIRGRAQESVVHDVRRSGGTARRRSCGGLDFRRHDGQEAQGDQRHQGRCGLPAGLVVVASPAGHCRQPEAVSGRYAQPCRNRQQQF
ncbi:hypothetical protein SAMN05428940_2859 [Streptomyces sp. 2133.1]|nr:hypothetical protein BX261_2855 [Streptomyces sp. 2321.6]SEC77666.1 hypothetical protein SAMN05428940_2859 [Streptomyces sp. 2133.1]SNC69016.1 hypothetical protein SAMN06272741_2852 [Streptomyces sp. 2114.4]